MMVPWTMVPFLSSICTVSLVSFMRNLQIIHKSHIGVVTASGVSRRPEYEDEEGGCWLFSLLSHDSLRWGRRVQGLIKAHLTSCTMMGRRL